jgi:hypothetical protein
VYAIVVYCVVVARCRVRARSHFTTAKQHDDHFLACTYLSFLIISLAVPYRLCYKRGEQQMDDDDDECTQMSSAAVANDDGDSGIKRQAKKANVDSS